MERIYYDEIVKYRIKAVCDSTLHIGSAAGGKEEVLVHPVDQRPFVQATSIAGAMRSRYLQRYGEEEMMQLFGGSGSEDAEYASRLKITDGLFDEETLHMELRPHVKIDEQTGAVAVDSKTSSGQKFDMEYLGAGAEFNFEIYLYLIKGQDERMLRQFEELLADMHAGIIVLGAKRSTGAGRSKLLSVQKKIFDMMAERDREQWRQEESLPDNAYEEYLDRLPQAEMENIAYRVYLQGEIEGAIQIKGIAVSQFGETAPASENIKNSKGENIIPGSSIRGVLRAQIKKIAGYLNKERLIDPIFGFGGERDGEGKRGNLICSDIVIRQEDTQEALIRNRIHIDKFSGGIIQLFKEQNETGRIKAEFIIRKDNYAEVTAAFLTMALRDMALGVINIGNGYATGKGFIRNAQILIQRNDINGRKREASICYDTEGNGTVADTSGLIKEMMNALKGAC